MSETQLQSAILAALQAAGIWAFRVNSGSSHGAGGRVHGAPKGTPDLCLPGLAAWIEVKLPGERLRPAQVKWHERAAREGVRVGVATSVDGALAVCRGWRAIDSECPF